MPASGGELRRRTSFPISTAWSAGSTPPRPCGLERDRSQSPSRAGATAACGEICSRFPPTAARSRRASTGPASPFLLRAGTFIPAVLSHRAVSDQPGLLRAVLTRDVYDSLAGRYLLLPRGTVALGRQGDLPGLGQSRLAILWTRLQLPDGSSLDLAGAGASLPSAARDGSAGLPGETRQHWGRRYGAAVLLSLVSAGLQLSQPQRSAGGDLPPGEIAAGAAGLELGRLSQSILRQYADLPPTIELAPGARVHLVVTHDLAFPSAYPLP